MYRSVEGVRRGQRCIAARFGEIVVVRVGLLLPEPQLAEFVNSLTELGVVVVGYRFLPVLLLEDFNAKNVAWGSRYTDTRGKMVEGAGDRPGRSKPGWVAG